MFATPGDSCSQGLSDFLLLALLTSLVTHHHHGVTKALNKARKTADVRAVMSDSDICQCGFVSCDKMRGEIPTNRKPSASLSAAVAPAASRQSGCFLQTSEGRSVAQVSSLIATFSKVSNK